MKDEQDAFGHEIHDHFEGKGGFEVVERDDGYIDANAGGKTYFSEHKDWSPSVKRAMRYVKGKVLDIGCGAGRHSLYLQGQGFDVLGIDNSPLALKVCRARGLKKAKVTSITEVTSKLGTFDTILMMGNNFGLFGGLKRARWLLRRFHKMTSDNARIIAQSRDPYDTTEPFHLEYHELNRKTGRMPGQLRIRIRYKKYATQWFDYLLVSRDEMQQVLEGTGWQVRRFLDRAGSAYVAIIEKQGG